MKFVLFFILFFHSNTTLAHWQTESFTQAVHLHKFDNTIVQGFVKTQRVHSWGAPYVGVWFDQDQKSASQGVFTDSQVSPLLGFKTNSYAEDILPSNFFVEFRAVLRTEVFPDQRQRFTGEGRGGILGYDKFNPNSYFFLEHYYALFYTHLYNSRVIFQGWSKQGFSVGSWDVFNELFADSFDFTRGQDATLDLRPGVRWSLRGEKFTLQLMHQYLHHFSNLNFAGRSEQRSTLVLGMQF
jgi:hypothetical protein